MLESYRLWYKHARLYVHIKVEGFLFTHTDFVHLYVVVRAASQSSALQRLGCW